MSIKTDEYLVLAIIYLKNGSVGVKQHSLICSFKLVDIVRYLCMFSGDRCGCDHMDLQSVPINTKIVSLNPIHGKVYLIQHYVMKLVAAGRWFSQGTPLYSTNKTDNHDITEILLKVALNTIN
jgi:hypothetical protein